MMSQRKPESVAEIWSYMLALGEVDSEDDFFELGGNSLLAVQMLSLVNRVFDVRVDLRTFFRASTLAALTEAVRRAQRSKQFAVTRSFALSQNAQEVC